MSRVPLIIANWKMYKSVKEARSFINSLIPLIASSKRRIFIAPSYPAIPVSVETAGNSSIVIGAQNIHDQIEGAFTGEVSAKMIKECGAQFSLIGHSERREYFQESNLLINRKLKRSLKEKLIPILCLGETLQERKGGLVEVTLRTQLEECLMALSEEEVKQVVIAYEPVWAIGAGKTATKEEAQDVHAFIRNYIQNLMGRRVADDLPILYGGSVKPENISNLMAEPDIDGALVGGASLDVISFAQIVNF
ncbi:Triosephosphate isomerase [Candidatus Rhabdochlamydia oedothoracis]|uniref:Triosephosphate isomerase n=1 Tax=Candidatus Rhabdochlamydia oedothoracis TaxID=2720720 RepID=A0ABX8V0R4_9BACT|nr:MULTISPECIES: triose-phosphate isomerase [Rhabdochlamydia]KAG6559133.1 Triosephosphate isomerase [Candidatus Rhabdochlamydia sp. W815]MCL6756207.1 triose-phosphate isomerase [Candidatus Rhabdochlamydia oedothoracis]QYF48824.1 Triosephosphate isomerase [Candidatus Rhabdochlamydia oedothoracis]